jgi:hypothetical protein
MSKKALLSSKTLENVCPTKRLEEALLAILKSEAPQGTLPRFVVFEHVKSTFSSRPERSLDASAAAGYITLSLP